MLGELAAREHPGPVVLQSFSPVVCAVATLEAPELQVELLARVPVADAAAWRGRPALGPEARPGRTQSRRRRRNAGTGRRAARAGPRRRGLDRR
ncbi:MAG: hypothetical protein MZV63_06100 [Marinilabiliales bacterium]|nr:hypothetical protein [Marinilabiliales bacterium]